MTLQFLSLLASLLMALRADAPAILVAAAESSGIDVAGMDKTVEPGDDFYRYANGRWLESTEIPPDRARYAVFSAMAAKTRERVVKLIQESGKSGATANDDEGKVGRYYSTFMDETAIELRGIKPLQSILDAITAIDDKRSLARAIGGSLRADVDPLNFPDFQTDRLLGIWVSRGLREPRNVPYLLQGGLGLPEREYYLSIDPAMAEIRKLYQLHIAKLLELAGFDNVDARATQVFQLEEKIAGVHATRAESADVQNAELWPRTELDARAPGLDWFALIEAAGLQDVSIFTIWHPKAVAGLSALVASEPLDVWKDWLAFHAVDRASNFLPKAFVDQRFAFHEKALNGIPQPKDRWQWGVYYTSAELGDVVGKLYVGHFFRAEDKIRIKAMVENIVVAFRARIDSLAWMSSTTKVKAKEKLAALRVAIGYPDRWQDYSTLEVIEGDALGNHERAELYRYRHQLAKLNESIDRDEWWMTPHTVNALNLPLQNALNFPAAILQSPLFDPLADAAFNYGSIGVVIGHEISHSFDDQGSQFDAEGRLRNWWSSVDLDRFRAAGAALVEQYDMYRPFPDLAVNGRQTLSENIADLAGLNAAYDAYRLSLQGQADVVVDGFTGDQRFFIAFAQSWRAKARDADVRNTILAYGHAPERYRAATVRNLESWYAAFSVRSGHEMYLDPKYRVHVW